MRLLFRMFIVRFAVCLVAVSGWGATHVKVWAPYGAVTNVPPHLTNAVAIATGDAHLLALTADGRVVGWGDNSYGQLNIPTGLSNVVAISAAHSNSMALTSAGRVVTWGLPICESNSVLDDLTNVVSIAGGSYYGFALREDGTPVTWACYWDWPEMPVGRVIISNALPIGSSNVVACAYSTYGRISLDGEGNARTRAFTFSAPVVTNLITASITYYHALGLTPGGEVVSWGAHNHGRVPPEITNAVAVAVYPNASVALLASGKLMRWTPYVDTVPPPGPPETIYEGTNVLAIAAAGNHLVALLNLDGLPPVGQAIPGPRAVTNGIAISFPTERGRIYLLEHKSTLTDAWAFNQLVAGNGGLHEVVVPAASQGFFRTRRVR